MTNRNLFISVVAILLLGSIGDFTPKPQSIAPSCFETEDCKLSIPVGYCDVKYDCVEGKCYNEIIKCPELCSGNKDEDMDKLIDCDDPDCFSSPLCPCLKATYNECLNRRCYCPFGFPQWVITEEDHWCECR